MKFSFFPAFLQSPRKIKFDKQEENEVIELFLRQHSIVNVGWVVTSLLLMILPPLLLQLDSIFIWGFVSSVPLDILLGGLIIYYLLIIAYAFEQFLSWYFNVYIVTNLHIVDINFHSLLSKEVVEISLNDIEVIAHNVAGVFGSLFHYGNVEIETAAETKRILFEKVPRPDIVTDKVQDLQRAKRAMGGGH
ncbi:MAG TPA: hypothetical protein VJG66_01850 [Patescibacteria group bacterium]|nr:hypothetical protein [Patescibacteria group bacterium]